MRLRLRVGKVMAEKNVSEAELAEKADVARNTVRSLMRGMNTRVDLEIMEKIAGALQVRPMELFEEVADDRGNIALTRRQALISIAV